MITCIIPIIIASKATYIIYSGVQIFQFVKNGARVVAVISDIIVTGHVESCLEEENKAPIITGKNAVYSHK
jgi:hypothetical protein